MVLILWFLEPSDLGDSEIGTELLPTIEPHVGNAHLRVISLTGVPDAACRKAKAICAGVKRFFRGLVLLPGCGNLLKKTTSEMDREMR